MIQSSKNPQVGTHRKVNFNHQGQVRLRSAQRISIQTCQEKMAPLILNESKCYNYSNC